MVVTPLKCKYCKNVIEDGSLYCRFCGSKLFKSQTKEISIPKPRILKDGSYTAQIMVNGKRQSVHASSSSEYEVKVRAIKLELLELKKAPPKITLRDAVQNYISKNNNTLSPSTIRGYNNILKNRFKSYLSLPIDSIDYQEMVNNEALICSAKTLRNSWALISSSLKFANFSFSSINLPSVPVKSMPFLQPDEIRIFLANIQGDSCEIAAILALHSLRMSELLAITRSDIDESFIYVNKSLVRDSENNYVLKNTTKTVASSRTIPIIIPRLLELIQEFAPDSRIVKSTPVTIERHIARACQTSDLSLCHCHDLRRTFASLGYYLQWSERTVMAIGGWSSLSTVHKVYIMLSNRAISDDVEKMKDFYKFTTEDSKPNCQLT